MATFMERLAFLQNVPTLMKATADDENPCPGYLFQEIGKISHASLGCGQCLLEYLLERLQVESCHVKIKVLKIFVHLCGHGSNNFLTELRRNSTFIQQASVYSGPPDPIHGTALYQKVRTTAQDVARLLFTDTIAIKNTISSNSTVPQTLGMGSATGHRSGMQGFGNNSVKKGTGSDSLLDKLQKAAEVVASAVLPPTEHQGIRLYDNHYRAVVTPTAPIEVAVPACSYNLPAGTSKATQRCPGQIGGGWEETDSGNSSSHNSSQDISAHSRVSVESKSAGTGSQSGASRESSADLSERVEALQLGDCGQEVALISRLTEGSRVFLSREESQHFIKECSTLNCDVVVDLLSNKLQDPSDTIKMRTMCAVAGLMTSDLISLEHIFVATQSKLRQLSEGPPDPVANKATKLLRQFEALMHGPQHAPRVEKSKSSHQTPNDLSSTYPLLQAHSADRTRSNHDEVQVSQFDILTFSTYVTQPLNHQLCFRSESQGDCVRTPEVEVRAEMRTDDRKVQTEGSSSPSVCEPQSSDSNRLSLFSGMELVTKLGPMCDRPVCEDEMSQAEIKVMDDSLIESQEEENSDNLMNTHSNSETTEDMLSHCNPVTSDGTQPVSAFLFLNS